MLKESFLRYLRFEKNYSEKTVVSYGIDLSGFEAYFKAMDETLDFVTVDADIIRGWVVFTESTFRASRHTLRRWMKHWTSLRLTRISSGDGSSH